MVFIWALISRLILHDTSLNVDFSISELIENTEKEINSIAMHNEAIVDKTEDLAWSYFEELNDALDGVLNERFKFVESHVSHQNWFQIKIGSGLSNIIIEFSTEYNSETKMFNKEIEGSIRLVKNWISSRSVGGSQFLNVESVGQILSLSVNNIKALALIEAKETGEISFETCRSALNKLSY